jgi:FkbM family methyltransferase
VTVAPHAALFAAAGVVRSVWLYHGRDRARRRRMDRLYGCFLRPGELVFDVGSHVGDRVASFLRLGCRVVAVEPQPALQRVLRVAFGRRRDVALVQAAAGEAEGELELHLNLPNPTVATGSAAFIAAADGAPGWEGQRWARRLLVPLTTLDALIAAHGRPAFVKIDVEGLEDRVLQGLSAAVPALSFEFTTIQRDVAIACLRRCAALGAYRFNASLGESHVLAHPSWLDADAIAGWIDALPVRANSGDVYAALDPPSGAPGAHP